MKIRVGDVLDDKYEIERHLATGGMGSIWVARDLRLCRRIAMKFIELAPRGAADAAMIRARFEREALAVARLRTPHVAQVYDHALDAETPYIVMEYLHGEDLQAILTRETRLTFPALVALMNQAARGLRAAHEAGVVHRDLKPANIFVAEVDHERVVKILDFGIAKVLDHRAVTSDGEIFGSARYMSPEQIAGAKDVDLRSDLWAMGVILYRALTGGDAFAGPLTETLQAQRLGRFPPPTSQAPELVPEVDAFFARALALEKNRRFLSATEMAEAFAEVAERQAAAITVVEPLAPEHLDSENSAKTTVFRGASGVPVAIAPRGLVAEGTGITTVFRGPSGVPVAVAAPPPAAPAPFDNSATTQVRRDASGYPLSVQPADARPTVGVARRLAPRAGESTEPMRALRPASPSSPRLSQVSLPAIEDSSTEDAPLARRSWAGDEAAPTALPWETRRPARAWRAPLAVVALAVVVIVAAAGFAALRPPVSTAPAPSHP